VSPRANRLLRRSREALGERISATLALLPRRDMPKLVGDAPSLLEVAPAELEARGAAIRKSYVPETIVRWERHKACRLLKLRATILNRLALVDKLNPNLRVALPDETFLSMSEETFRRRFVEKTRWMWRRRPGANSDPPARSVRPLLDVEPPPGVNVLAWGREQVKRQAQQAQQGVGASAGHGKGATPSKATLDT
jgi:hypothetical protein